MAPKIKTKGYVYANLGARDGYRSSSLEMPGELQREFTAMLALAGTTKSHFFISLMRALINGDIQIAYDATISQKTHFTGDTDKFIRDKTLKLYTKNGVLINETDAIPEGKGIN